MAESDSTPPVKSSTVAKTGAITGILATIVLVWQTVSPLLPAVGVPPKVVTTIQSVVQLAEDNKDRLDQLEQAFEAWRAKHPPVVTPPQNGPTPLPITPADIQSLKDEIERLKNQPPPPIQIQPQPVQPPVPVLSSAIKAVDSQGKPVTDVIDSGKQFKVQASQAGTWTTIPNSSPDVDCVEYGNDLVCVLRNDASLTIVHASGSPITTSVLQIKCNHGAQPPPLVIVDPVKPQPPGTRKFNVYVVEDLAVKRSAVTANILMNLTTRKAFTDKGCEIVPMVSAADPAAVYAKQQQAPLPAIVLFDTSTKQFVKAAPLPTDLGLSLMASMGG